LRRIAGTSTPAFGSQLPVDTLASPDAATMMNSADSLRRAEPVTPEDSTRVSQGETSSYRIPMRSWWPAVAAAVGVGAVVTWWFARPTPQSAVAEAPLSQGSAAPPAPTSGPLVAPVDVAPMRAQHPEAVPPTSSSAPDASRAAPSPSAATPAPAKSAAGQPTTVNPAPAKSAAAAPAPPGSRVPAPSAHDLMSDRE
jgi:hypothetical protein